MFVMHYILVYSWSLYYFFMSPWANYKINYYSIIDYYLPGTVCIHRFYPFVGGLIAPFIKCI